jgi:hypothetical protein
MRWREMNRLLCFVLLVLPMTVSAYGNRNWLSANQYYSEKLDNTYSWGYNYHARGRHTTIRLEEDKAGWMHNGNMRNSSSTGDFHWQKLDGHR